MNTQQAFNNLMQLLNHAELRLSYQEHCGLRQSLRLLHEKAAESEELKKQIESEKEEKVDDSPNE